MQKIENPVPKSNVPLPTTLKDSLKRKALDLNDGSTIQTLVAAAVEVSLQESKL